MNAKTPKACSVALACFIVLGLPDSAQAAAADAEAEIRSWSMVIDMVHQPGQAVEWIIGVRTDGTKRYGLASSACETIKQHDADDDSTIVRIVDFDQFMQSGGDARGASLGSVDCGTYEQIDP